MAQSRVSLDIVAALKPILQDLLVDLARSIIEELKAELGKPRAASDESSSPATFSSPSLTKLKKVPHTRHLFVEAPPGVDDAFVNGLKIRTLLGNFREEDGRSDLLKLS